MWTWRLRVPQGGCGGHHYFDALGDALAAHVARNLETMLRNGWPPDQAEAATREWLHRLVDGAIEGRWLS